MRRIPILLLLLLPSALLALYMGNPGEPQMIDQGFFISQDCAVGVKVGYQGDRVLDRLLRAGGKVHGRIDHFDLQMDQGMVAFNYLDRFEIYGTVGSLRSYFWNSPKVDHQRREFETHHACTGGGGARVLLAQWGNMGMGADVKIQYGRPAIEWISVNGTSHASEAHLTFREWQASLALFHTIDLFTPYLGAKYSNVHAEVNGLSRAVYPSTHFKMYSRRRFGMTLGCTLSQGKKVELFAEAQLIDEQGVTFGGSLKF